MILSNPVGTLGTGRKVVTSAGTAETLVDGSKIVASVAIQAETDNTNNVAVGDANVVAAAGSERGLILAAGESTTMSINDLVRVYVDAVTNGEGVTYLYLET
jgi:hypothetical protein